MTTEPRFIIRINGSDQSYSVVHSGDEGFALSPGVFSNTLLAYFETESDARDVLIRLLGEIDPREWPQVSDPNRWEVIQVQHAA